MFARPEQTVLHTKINMGLDEFPDWAIIQVSADGESWTEYQGKYNDRKEWVGGKLEELYRFVRVVNTSASEQECYLKAFEVKIK